ncbi:MAG: ParB/RepB/Spo0J family partition protein [Sulfobacillus thermotolerans]|nr:ParB/RepB/Spo0J family partition protein [Sulfobacillus thermotolerans]
MAKTSRTEQLTERLARVSHAARANTTPAVSPPPEPADAEMPSPLEPAATPQPPVLGHTSGEMRYMPVSLLTPGYNARTIDPDLNPEEWDSFLRSIQTAGLIQPIVVAPDTTQEGHYCVIAGNRRFLAIQMLGWDTVPVVVKQIPPTEQMATMLAENLARKDMDLYEEARGFEALIAAGMPPHQIAQRVQRSASYISLARKCIRHPALAQALEHKQINRAAAMEVSRLLTADGEEKHSGSVAEILAWIERKHPPLEAIRTACQNILADHAQPATPTKKTTRRYRVFVERIQDTLLHEMPKRWDGLSLDDLEQLEQTLAQAITAVVTQKQKALQHQESGSTGIPEDPQILADADEA